MPTNTITQLQRALAIAEQIQKLEQELEATLAGSSIKVASVRPAAAVGRPKGSTGKRGRKPFSAETKARMAEAQRARWAAKKGGASASASKAAPAAKPAKGKRRRRTMSAEAREKIAAAQRARWAKSKGE